MNEPFRITIGETAFRPLVDNLTMAVEEDQLKIQCGTTILVNQCECCGRGDLVPDIVHSWEEAMERGWIEPIPPPAPEPTPDTATD